MNETLTPTPETPDSLTPSPDASEPETSQSSASPEPLCDPWRKIDALVAQAVRRDEVVWDHPDGDPTAPIEPYRLIDDAKNRELVPAYHRNLLEALTIFGDRTMAGQHLGWRRWPRGERTDLTDVDREGWAREWYVTSRGKPCWAPTPTVAIVTAALATAGFHLDGSPISDDERLAPLQR